MVKSGLVRPPFRQLLTKGYPMALRTLDQQFSTVTSMASALETVTRHFREVAQSPSLFDRNPLDMDNRVINLMTLHNQIIIAVAQLSMKLERLILTVQPQEVDPVFHLVELP